MNFNLQPQDQQEQQYNNVTPVNQTTYTAPICTPTGHTFGQQSHTQHVFYHHHHYDYYWTPYQQQQHEQQQQQQQVPPPPVPAQFSTWVPPDPFVPVFEERPHKSPVQPKEQILEEIVRECEEIERRSSSGGSPASSIWSSDEREGETATPNDELPSYHPYKTPERKERKKAQNRLAATRYREKKRREKELTMGCIEDLSATNGTLKATVSELEKEITYLKKLMTELGITPDQQSS